MIASLVAVLGASFIGSPHCAGMCGPFAALATVGRRGPSRPQRGTAIAYNLGRLVAYVLVGTFAGLAGLALDLGGAASGLQHTATWIAGTAMILVGAAGLARSLGVRVPGRSLSPTVSRRVSRAFAGVGRLSPVPRALGIGMATSLLPCGWLWVFAIAAAGTGHPLSGAATMAAFWLGTVPMMSLVAGVLQRVSAPVRARLPWVSATVVLLVGVYTLAVRTSVPAPATPSGAATISSDEVPPCHR